MNKISFFNKITKKSLAEPSTAFEQQLISFLNLGGTSTNKLSEATYFACLKILSESMGKLPLKLQISTPNNGIVKAVDHKLYSVCKYRPNPYMTASTFWGTVENNRNHYGNAYCLITGYPLKTQLWILGSENVEVWYDDAKLLSNVSEMWYIYTSPTNGARYKFSSAEVLHFKTSTTFDGIKGVSVRNQLVSTIEGGQKSQQMLNGLYDNGFTAKAVVQYTGDLSLELEKKFTKGIENFALGKDEDLRAIIPIPFGATLTPINIKLTDSQFLELRKYSALQIAAAFGIKPNQINDYEKSSYASAEAQQLAFYIDTLLYIVKQYEEELTYKLLTTDEVEKGYHFKFNISVILRADEKSQLESLSNAVANAIRTPNEARALLDLPSKEGGDELYFNGSNIPIKLAGQQYAKGGV